MKAAAIVIVLLLLSSPSFARVWKVNGPPQADDLIIAEWYKLPNCIQADVDLKLRKIVLVPKDSLGKGIDARSYKNGIMLLVWQGKALTTTAFLHEIGHYYDWANNDISKAPAFAEAINLDYALTMDDGEPGDNNYIRQPGEAFAELFATLFRGEAYFTVNHYDTDDMPRSMQWVKNSLCK